MDSKKTINQAAQQSLKHGANRANKNPLAQVRTFELKHQSIRTISRFSVNRICLTVMACLLILPPLTGCKDSWSADSNPKIAFDTKYTQPSIPALNAIQPSKLFVHFPIDRDSVDKAKAHARHTNTYQPEIPTHALRLHDSKIKLNEKISITPHVEGTWAIEDDSISLQPKAHWPANVTYTLTISDDLFMDNVIRKSKTTKFTTKGFTVEPTQSRLYFDPTKPGEQRFVSTLQFSHPINPDSLKEHYTLSIPDASGVRLNLPFTFLPDEQNTHQKNRVFHITSEQIELNSSTRFLRATLSGNLRRQLLEQQIPTGNTTSMHPMLTERIKIPSVETLFSVAGSDVQIVRNEKAVPQKMLNLLFSSSTSAKSIRQHVKLQLLPETIDGEQTQMLSSAQQVTAEMEAAMINIPYTVLPTVEVASQTFNLEFEAPADHQMLLTINKGLKATAGYTISNDFTKLLTTPAYPTELAFLGDGSVLDSNGSHQIGFVSRNVDNIDLEIGRISMDDLHHLISQTYGQFDNTLFQGLLDVEDIAVVFKKSS